MVALTLRLLRLVSRQPVHVDALYVLGLWRIYGRDWYYYSHDAEHTWFAWSRCR